MPEEQSFSHSMYEGPFLQPWLLFKGPGPAQLSSIALEDMDNIYSQRAIFHSVISSLLFHRMSKTHDRNCLLIQA